MKKSPNDHKKYQTFTLANGLRVLLIENTRSNKAAAALAVNVGHFNDPNNRQGMAHFVEHMLFLGTTTYPESGDYQKFISQFGGCNNAWTGTEHTCFYFDIAHTHFEQALDRFSRFFYEPLFSQELLDNERQNIDAEFKLKLKDDVRRLYDVHKETVNPAHPFAKFSVGNNETLRDRHDGKMRDEISAFFNQYYRAENMTLAIESPFSLEAMHQIVTSKFSPIAEAVDTLPAITTPLYLAEHQKIRINVKPVKQERQLIISFSMPSIDEFYRHKTEMLLTYLLGHEGPGSILSLLKSKQWALSLTAGSGINGSNFKDFNLSISLTEQGALHVDDIISICFSYIHVLKNSKPIPPHYYDDKQAMLALSFKFQEVQKPIDWVCQLAVNMQHYPEQDYIFGDYAMDGVSDSVFKQLLSYLTPENIRVTHINKDNTFDKLSHWYHVDYSLSPINEATLAAWHSPPENPRLHLPEKNAYIVQQHCMLDVEEEQQCKTPYLLEEDSGINIWFKQDTSYNVPKGYLYIAVDLPDVMKSTMKIAMLRLFVDLYSDTVLEKNYNAELAGIHYHLYAHQAGVTLQVSGLSQKQPELLQCLLKQLTQHDLNEQLFEQTKSQLIQHWHNAKKSKSISQLFDCLSSYLQPYNPCNQALASALETVTFEAFSHFSKNLFNEVYIDVLVHGNWQVAHAKHISQLVKTSFNEHLNNKFIVNVPCVDTQSQGKLILPLHIPNHDHACVVYFPLPEKSLKANALAMITSQLLSADFFQEMRTNKQYGYLVGVGFVPVNRYPGIAFYIQSPHTDATTLMKAIETFVDTSKQRVNCITAEHWQHLKKGLAAQLTESDSSLRIKSQRFWGAISNKDDGFSQKKQLVNIIESLTLADIYDFISQYINTKEETHNISLLAYSEPEQFSHAQYSARNICNDANKTSAQINAHEGLAWKY